ncbi:hypothetical protein SAMN06265365_1388 [Tistlia consotensis]|uniref:DUF1318 domain-containing protein n=1 Tax=Tistlia consotensis USBA 355 TaxID=560819 RepID=A0A1Y6CTZ4_9PROT|nr:YdbL family protein [Tistlia consotensis]SMF77846.1 hypothetical protein SAMN05428998_13755 [Tistlia consotensis USBA 355]SNS20328.1 hypothetical protein SAMN06265365_1388 [Tistlia consotensis]
MMSRRLFVAALSAAALTATLAGPSLLGPGFLRPSVAWAQTPEALLTSGAAGERWDGYMEARSGSAAGAVASINAKRKQVYEKRAAEQGVPVEAVAKIYAQELINKAPAGSWVKRENGQWVQK